jgi:hypothetical protein
MRLGDFGALSLRLRGLKVLDGELAGFPGRPMLKPLSSARHAKFLADLIPEILLSRLTVKELSWLLLVSPGVCSGGFVSWLAWPSWVVAVVVNRSPKSAGSSF